MDRSSKRHFRQHCTNVRRVADLIQQIEHFDQVGISPEYDHGYTVNSLRSDEESTGMLPGAHPDSRETTILDHSIVQSSRVNDLRRLQRNSSDIITQNRTVGPFSSDMKKVHSKTRVLNDQKICQTSNTGRNEPCRNEPSRVKLTSGKTASEMEFQEIQGGGVESNNCFGRSTCTPAKLSRGSMRFLGELIPEVSPSEMQFRERNGFLANSTTQTSCYDVSSREGTEFSRNLISRTSSHDVLSRGKVRLSGRGSSHMHLESKKSKRPLRNFGCMSSVDALPALVSTTGSRNALQEKKSEKFRDSRQVGSFLARSTGCISHRISHRGFLIPETSLSNLEQCFSSTKRSSLPDSNDSSVRPTTSTFASGVPRPGMPQTGTEMEEARNELGNGRNTNPSMFSTNSFEDTSQSSFIEPIGRFSTIHSRDIVRNMGEIVVAVQKTEVDSTSTTPSSSTTSGYINALVSSNTIDLSSSTCRSGPIASTSSYEMAPLNEDGGRFSKIQDTDMIRNIREMVIAEQRAGVDSIPSSSSSTSGVSSNIVDPSSSSSRRSEPIASTSLYEHIHNHTESNEDVSYPSSCTSSPDVHRPSESRSFNSQDLRQMLSSQYYQLGYRGRSARAARYCPFRRFPLRTYDENDEYCTFGGPSEVLSTRGHVERDEIAYEQAFMLEAHLLLGGISSYDRHQDLRLDIDNMSYEELLSLEERIGFVSTGLEKDMIPKCVQSEIYYCTNRNAAPYLASDNVEVSCSICQEEFEEYVELGLLKCGHKYHLACIEQWLQRKNECPICKVSALVA